MLGWPHREEAEQIRNPKGRRVQAAPAALSGEGDLERGRLESKPGRERVTHQKPSGHLGQNLTHFNPATPEGTI